MHLRHFTGPRRQLTASGRGLLLCVLALACGCETRGFVDPSEMGRYKKDALVLPVVSQIDPAVEEPDNQWTQATEPTADDLRPVTSDYRISPNDLLAITLSDLNGPNTETVKQARVTESGNISLPFLDQPLHAAGLTEIQLEQAVIDAYHNANLIQHAQVSVTVLEARGRTYNVLGAVGAPAEYVIAQSDFRLLNALVTAHDVSSPFVDYIYVIRQIGEPAVMQVQPPTGPTRTRPGPSSAPTTGPSSEELAPPRSEANTPMDLGSASAPIVPEHVVHLAAAAEDAQQQQQQQASGGGTGGSFEGFRDPSPEQNVRVIRIPYAALRRGDLKYNIAIHPHDLIYVPNPEVGYYFVGGHVARGGTFQFTGQKITIKDAIISANMLDGLAIPQRTDIIREIHPDHEVFVRVDLAKIFAGEEPDVYLKPGDKIMVGTNAIAPFLAAIRGGFRITYGFGFLYDRNYAYPTRFGSF